MRRKLFLILNHMDCFWTRRLPIALEAQTQGWDVHVCAHGALEDDKLSKMGFTGYELPDAKGKFSVFANLHIVYAVWRTIRDNDPDIVHAMTLKYGFFTGLACRFMKAVPQVHTIAGLGYLFSGDDLKSKVLKLLVGPFLRFSLRQKQSFISFQNPDDMRLLIDHGYVEEERSILIRGSGVDLDFYDYHPEPSSEKPLVILPTRLIHEKGVSVFIEACKILHERGIEADYQIAGGGAPYNPREISAEQMQAMLDGSPVKWLGHVDDMPALYAAANLIVYPSYYGEGVPKVLLEAAATGRAIITTDNTGCREAVEDGKTGILIPIKDAEATANAMATLIQDATLRSKMGKAAREFAKDHYDVKSVVARTLKIYDRALAEQ